jgi:glycine cleavage system aminomethyltransferase T
MELSVQVRVFHIVSVTPFDTTQFRLISTFARRLVYLTSDTWYKQSTASLLFVGFSLFIRKCSFRGSTATAFLEWITPSSLSSLDSYASTLSVILNEQGGIIDDTVITKHAADAYYVVTNAGRRDRDLPWFTEKLEQWNMSPRSEAGRVEMEVLEDWGLLALQGAWYLLAHLLTVI